MSLRGWVKRREHPLADVAFRLIRGWRVASVPTIPVVHRLLYDIRNGCLSTARFVYRAAWSTPLFQSRLLRPAPRLYLYGGIPLVIGPVEIELGADCRVCGQTTITGRSAGRTHPRLTVGRNVDIGWQTTIAVGKTITIGDNVRIAGRAFLAGYPGHPVDARRPRRRLAGYGRSSRRHRHRKRCVACNRRHRVGRRSDREGHDRGRRQRRDS